MLSQKTISTCLEIITQLKNETIATKLHMEHQLSLPHNYRITSESDNILEENIEQLNSSVFELNTTIEELNGYQQPIHQSEDHPGLYTDPELLDNTTHPTRVGELGAVD